MTLDIKTLRSLIEIQVKKLDYDFYDLQYVKERKTNILRVLIDKTGGIDIDDCVKVSETVSTYLDEIDPISEDYSLEVSSPGAERLLRSREEVLRAVGRFVHIDTYEQKFEGELMGFEGDTLTIKVKNKNIDISYLDITLIRMAIKL